MRRTARLVEPTETRLTASAAGALPDVRMAGALQAEAGLLIRP